MSNGDIRGELNSAKSDLDAAESELEELRRRVQDLEAAAEFAEQGEGISKRDVAQIAWVAPVVMAVNLPNSVFAQNAVSPVAAPTATQTATPTGTNQPTGTARPTRRPTNRPTRKPTNRPTNQPSPSPSPTTAGSDYRLKRDIERLATLDNGIGIYAFRYLWDDVSHVGVMAQDLLATEEFADAVVPGYRGYYTVDYAKVGLRMTTYADWQARGTASVLARRDCAECRETRQ